MGRPAKAVSANAKNMTIEERAKREAVENLVRGNADKLKAPSYLTRSQKKVFTYILNNLKESNMLGNLDIFILSQTAIAVDRVQEFDKKANSEPDILLLSSFRQARAEASKEFFRCCNELCLSPQSRAKLSISVTKPEEKKTIMDLINEDDDE